MGGLSGRCRPNRNELVGWSVGRLADWSVGRLIGWPIGRLADWWSVWLVGWLVQDVKHMRFASVVAIGGQYDHD